MAKQYGLIKPEKSTPLFKKPAIFGDDSDSDDDSRRNIPTAAHQNVVRQQDLAAQQKALEEDPTVFQYDEVYDDIETQRNESKLARKDIDKKPKYIHRLLQTANRRKREFELRLERQVQKERAAEGDEFKDKEEFVTSAYRKKLEELKQLEEEEKREEYLEKIGDVTKQADLGGFYRHLYEQQVVGVEEKKDTKDEVTKKSDSESESERKSPILEKTKESTSKVQSSSKVVTKDRKYRKRENPDKEESDDEEVQPKVQHLQSNLDADSDFSIESSSEDDDQNGEDNKKDSEESKEIKKEDDEDEEKFVKPKKKKEVKDSSENEDKKIEVKEEKPLEFEPEIPQEVVEIKVEEKKPKIDIWKKRTVGIVFDEALIRYYARKSTREQMG